MSTLEISDALLLSLAGPLAAAGMVMGPDLREQVKVMAADSISRLALSAGQPGFDEAFSAECDVLAMKVGLHLVNNTTGVNLIGLLEGGLRLAVQLLATGLII